MKLLGGLQNFICQILTKLSFNGILPLWERPESMKLLGGLQGLLVCGESLKKYKLALEFH